MYKKILSNTIAQVLSKVSTGIISIFLLSILTNYLTVELFGSYSKIYNYLGIFSFFADLGLYSIAIREMTKNSKDTEKIIGNVMSLRLLLGIIIIFLSIGIAYFIPGYNSNLMLVSIFIVSIFTIFGLLNSSILSLMQTKMKIEFSLFSTVLGKMLNLSLIILVVFVFFNKENLNNMDAPFIFIMLSGLAGVFVNTLSNFMYARRLCKISFLFDFEYMKYIFRLSLPYGIALFLSIIYFKIDIIILSLIEDNQKANISIALYSLPMKIIEVLMVMGGFYLNSILPSLTNFLKNKENNKVKILLENSFKILFSSSLIIFFMGILFRENIIEIIANESYLSPNHNYNSADGLMLVLGVIIFHFVSLIYIYIFIASKSQKKLLKINVFITVLNIIGNIIMIPKYSFVGAGIVTIISQIILMILTRIESKKIINFEIPILFIIKSLFYGIILFILGIFFTNNYHLGIIIDILVYGFLLSIIYIWLIKKDIKLSIHN